MEKVHCVFYVLYYNTVKWWNCDDETITQYPGYPMNIYNDLSIGKKQKSFKNCVWMDQVVFCLCYIL